MQKRLWEGFALAGSCSYCESLWKGVSANEMTESYLLFVSLCNTHKETRYNICSARSIQIHLCLLMGYGKYLIRPSELCSFANGCFHLSTSACANPKSHVERRISRGNIIWTVRGLNAADVWNRECNQGENSLWWKDAHKNHITPAFTWCSFVLWDCWMKKLMSLEIIFQGICTWGIVKSISWFRWCFHLFFTLS